MRSEARVRELIERLGPGPWSVHELRQAGHTRAQTERDAAEGRLVRVRRGYYGAPVAQPPRSHVQPVPQVAPPRAGLLVGFDPSAALSHSTAGSGHGLWQPYPLDARLHVTISGGVERSDDAVRIHGSRLLEDDVVLLGGVRVTSLARTALDLGRGRSFRQALVPLDSAVRQLVLGPGLTAAQLRMRSYDDAGVRAREQHAQAVLDDAFSRIWSWPGTRVLRAALDAMDCRAETPYESWSRGCLLAAGLPRPRVGMLVRGASGATYFGDLVWEERRVIGEADGLTKLGTDPATVRERLSAERVRQRDLEDAGWTVVRWTAGESAARLTARAARALALARP